MTDAQIVTLLIWFERGLPFVVVAAIALVSGSGWIAASFILGLLVAGTCSTVTTVRKAIERSTR